MLYDFVEGRLFPEPAMPGCSAEERAGVYQSMGRCMAQLHSIDPAEVGLADFGKSSGYFSRQVRTWWRQYEASAASAGRGLQGMPELHQWLAERADGVQQDGARLVHGDFRLDNLIVTGGGASAGLASHSAPTVAALLDWELCTLGHPLADLAHNCLPYYMSAGGEGGGVLRGLQGQGGALPPGVPDLGATLDAYAAATHSDYGGEWDFAMAFTCFRLAAILQGVYARHLMGTASASNAAVSLALAQQLVDLGGGFMPAVVGVTAGRSLSAAAAGHVGGGGGGAAAVSDAEAKDMLLAVQRFVKEEIMPVEATVLAQWYARGEERWQPTAEVEALKQKAKAAGLWNMFLPPDSDAGLVSGGPAIGARLSNAQYAPIAEATGHSLVAPEVFNCSAPDTGNMEVLSKYGSAAQQEEWLQPLASGRIRSAFAMTEPAVASSDATNICARVERDGDHFVVNAHKWWISGAMDPRCELLIVMGRRGDGEQHPAHQQQSMIIVPMRHPRVEVLRPLSVFGYDDAPHGHAELMLTDVRVPASNLLLGEGRGFEIAQGRLGPGRIHHCMRLIGGAERALALMCERADERHAFGGPLSGKGGVRSAIAEARLDIEQARLLTLHAARLMDSGGNKAARAEVALIKIAAPRMAGRVLDAAMQVHGAKGLSQDTPLAHLFAWARILRLADGPDEVHLETVAKMELRKQMKQRTS